MTPESNILPESIWQAARMDAATCDGGGSSSKRRIKRLFTSGTLLGNTASSREGIPRVGWIPSWLAVLWNSALGLRHIKALIKGCPAG